MYHFHFEPKFKYIPLLKITTIMFLFENLFIFNVLDHSPIINFFLKII